MGFFLFSGAGSSTILSNVAPFAASADPAPAPQIYSVKMTGYNAVPSQTDDVPDMTASGVYADADVVAARSVDLADELPFGTVIEIDGPPATSTDPSCGFELVQPMIGYRVIADSMHSRKRDQIDILFHTDSSVSVGGTRRNAATALGICKGVTITVVGHIDIKDMPRSQMQLAQMIGKASFASAK